MAYEFTSVFSSVLKGYEQKGQFMVEKYIRVLYIYNYLKMNWWIDFSSFSTVFQSYQDNGRVTMKGFVACL